MSVKRLQESMDDVGDDCAEEVCGRRDVDENAVTRGHVYLFIPYLIQKSSISRNDY